MLELLDPVSGDFVLDLAAGPGDTGFLAAPWLGAEGRLLSTDVAPEMVAVATRRASDLGLTNVELRVMDMTALDLADGSVDGILCRWGLMLVDDMVSAAREIVRVLRPGGRAAFAVWTPADRNPWISAAGREAVELGFAPPPEPDQPGPFRLADPARLVALLEGAGLAIVVVEEVDLTWRAPSLAAWWDVVLDTSRALGQLAERLSAEELATLQAGAERRLAAYVDGDGALAVPSVARVALVTRPG